MKDKILKIAGVKSEAAFYKKFPTEAAFKKAHGKELKKAQLGVSMAPEIGSYTGGQRVNNSSGVKYNQLYDDVDLSITGLDDKKRMEIANLQAQQSQAQAAQKQANKKGIMDAISAGMGKNGKRVKKAQGGAGVDPTTAGSSATGSYVGAGLDIAQGIGDLKGEADALDLAKQSKMVSDVSLQAANTLPEQYRRQYNLPKVGVSGGTGIGTNYLQSRNGSVIGGNPTEIQNTYAPNNTLYDDLGYEPLEDDEQVKQYKRGGIIAQQGFNWNNFANKGGTDIAGNLGQYAGSGKPGPNAGSKIGKGAGTAIGTAFGGPLGGMIGGFLGGAAGGLIDGKPRQTADFNEKTQGNVGTITFGTGVRGMQQGKYSGFMEDGGWMNPEYNPQVIAKFGDHTAQDYYNAGHEGMDSLRSGGHLTGDYTPPSEEAMQTYALGGELKTLWGGHAEPISHNPYLPGSGETVMFRGQSHDNGGIGVSYGKKGQDSYTDYAEYGTEAAMDQADVEVEGGEPMVELEEGGQIDPATGEAQKAGVVFGNLVLDDWFAKELGLEKEAGRKMKHIVRDWSKGEAKQNKIIEKSLKIVDDHDDSTAWDQLAYSTAKAMKDGANMKLKEYADNKIVLAGGQGALNDTADEYGVVADDLARGKITMAKSNDKTAKFGTSLEKAQTGTEKKKKKVVVPDEPIAPYVGRGEFREDPDDANIYSKLKSEYFKPANLTHEAVAKMMAERKINMPKKQLPEPKKDWTDTAMMAYNELLPLIRPGYKIDQPDLSSEMMAAGMNQVEPVQAQLLNPYLAQTRNISFQDRLNANQADFNALQRLTGYNPAAQHALAAQKYAANNAILAEQFRTNQDDYARVSEKNRDIMTQTDMTNLGILDKQYERQSTAKSKTKAQAIEIAKSISDKLAQAKKEQRMSNLEQQRYNFRFDANGRPINMNPFAKFNTSGIGGSGGLNKQTAYQNAKDLIYDYDEERKEERAAARKAKTSSRNGSIVKAIKNL
jgi:hypothetical protein